MTINSDANYDGVLAGSLGGMCAGQLSTNTTESDYDPLVTVAVGSASAVDALVGVTSAPPPLVAQTDLLDEISFAWWMQRNPISGTNGDTSTEIALALDADLIDGVYGAFKAALVPLGAGTAGDTPIFRNAALAGAMGGLLAGATNRSGTTADYAYVADEADNIAGTVDLAIGVIGGPSVIQANLVCELVFAWYDGRNPAGVDDRPVYSDQAEAIAAVYTLGAAAIASPPDGAPTSARVWDAAFVGCLGGMLAGQLSTTTTGFAPVIAAAAAFAYSFDAVFAANGGRGGTVAADNLLRQLCHAWMRNRNPPDNTDSTTADSYDDISEGIFVCYDNAFDALV